MDPRAIFGINVLMSFVSSAVIAKLYVWPWLRTMSRNYALIRLVAPEVLRFVVLPTGFVTSLQSQAACLLPLAPRAVLP